jgi:hypothetical protein
MPPDRSIVDAQFSTGTRPGWKSCPLLLVTFAVVCQFFYLFYSGQIGSVSWTVFSHINPLLEQHFQRYRYSQTKIFVVPIDGKFWST